jgi:VanZ family protein
MRGFLLRLMNFRWLITGCLAAAILVLSLLPNPPRLDMGVSYGDKIGHFVAYLVFGATLLLSTAWKRPGKRGGRLAAAACSVSIAVCFGALIELLQHFTGRQTELLDVAADLAGALAGAGLALPVISRLRAAEGTTEGS